MVKLKLIPTLILILILILIPIRIPNPSINADLNSIRKDPSNPSRIYKTKGLSHFRTVSALNKLKLHPGYK